MIVDCFPFFNELDLLEIRLHELKGIVDLFVLTESPYTFTGNEKPLYFEENKKRFRNFNIDHIVYTPKEAYSPMEYERHQKQFGLNHAFSLMQPGDILAHGDVDEIPRASVVRKAVTEEWGAVRLIMPLFYYYMNCMNTTNRKHKTTRLVRYKEPFEYRSSQKFEVDKEYYNAGWNFSFLGDVQYKLESWNHAPEYNKPPFNTPEHIEKCREQGLDLFNRKGSRRLKFKFITSDLNYLPQHVLDNMDKFAKYIKL